MSDDRLFASNNAIGRKWYFLNLIILATLIIVCFLYSVAKQSYIDGFISINFICINMQSYV